MAKDLLEGPDVHLAILVHEGGSGVRSLWTETFSESSPAFMIYFLHHSLDVSIGNLLFPVAQKKM